MKDSTTPLAIEAYGLVKRYGEKTALDGVDLDVARGSVCALLGPNGAGKTTAVRVLTTLTEPDAGTARVAGHDIATDSVEVRRSIGLAAQDATVDGLLTGHENLTMIGELFHLGRKRARARADELLVQFALTDSRDRLAKEYSGGMRRRLDLAATLVATPELLFLDEPTTGLDPRARNELWGVLDELVGGGTTILLTTQYLEEADRLAQRIAVVDHGKIAAEGTAKELKATVGAEVLSVRVDPTHSADAAAVLADITDEPIVDAVAGEIRLAITNPSASAEAVRRLDSNGLPIAAIELQQPSLDDVFLTLTGKKAA